jgi:four helix bundle protein
MGNEKFIKLQDLEVYGLARKLSALAWTVYKALSWEGKKIMGDQFIRAADSVGANIAEGYRRYHRLDQIKFYYNSRASLSECCDHWIELLLERKMVDNEVFKNIKEIETKLSIKLANFIASTYKQAVTK